MRSSSRTLALKLRTTNRPVALRAWRRRPRLSWLDVLTARRRLRAGVCLTYRWCLRLVRRVTRRRVFAAWVALSWRRLRSTDRAVSEIVHSLCSPSRARAARRVSVGGIYTARGNSRVRVRCSSVRRRTSARGLSMTPSPIRPSGRAPRHRPPLPRPGEANDVRVTSHH